MTACSSRGDAVCGTFHLLALAAVAAVIAGCDCGSQQPRAGKGITFWHIQTTGPTKDVIDAAVGRFEAAHPGCSVKVSPVQNDPFKSKLAVAMTAGSPPDVFYTWGGGVLASDARAGRILELSSRIPEDGLTAYNGAALDFCRNEGRLYALPADVAAVVFWYNKDIFKRHGLVPPQTFSQLLEVCGKLKAAGVTPLALGNSDKWPGAFYFCYLALRLGGLEPFAEALARKRGPGFEHPSFITAGELTRSLADDGFFSRGFNGVDYTRARQLFFEGRAAMILMGPWLLGNAREEAPEGFIDKMGCFAFPEVVGGRGDKSLVLGGVNAGYAVSSQCRHPDEAVALIRELTSVETAREWAKTGRIPALRTDLVQAMLPSETREVAAVLGRAEAIQLYYDQALPPELAELHKTTTQGVLGGTTTPEDAARLMEEKARALLESAGQ